METRQVFAAMTAEQKAAALAAARVGATEAVLVALLREQALMEEDVAREVA
jgi:hypothetical protein